MTRFPESIQVTVHVLQSQQQAGPLWKLSGSFSDGHVPTEPEDERASQHDQPTWTDTNRGPPPWDFKRRLCWGDVLTKRSQWREGMHMTRLVWRGPAGDGGYIRSPMPWPSLRQIGGLSPNEPWPPSQDHNQQPRQPLGSFEVCVIGWWRWIMNDSDLVLAFSHHISFIHTSYSDEQCITQKYKGKILVLHYTFSKIYTE